MPKEFSLAAAAFTNFSAATISWIITLTMDQAYARSSRCGCSTTLLPTGKPAVIWSDDPKSDEVIERAQRLKGHELLTVGRQGDLIRLDRLRVRRPPSGRPCVLEHGGEALSGSRSR